MLYSVRILKYNALGLVVFGCISVRPVTEATYVNTKSKEIYFQKKKTFGPKNGCYFSNNFDGGRLNDVRAINDTLVEVVFIPENTPINPSAYYAFKAWSSDLTQLTLRFSYPNKAKHRYIPKIKYSESKHWCVPVTKNSFYKDSLYHLKINLSKDTLLIAAQEIIDSKAVERWVKDSIITDKFPFAHLQIYGKSILGKELNVIDIYKNSPVNKPIIVLLTRQHPPEITGFLAFKYFLSTLLDSSYTDDFLDTYRVIAFPLINPDGVDLGNWRHNAHGVDLNRDWHSYNQKEIKLVVKYLEKSLKRSKSYITLGLDFHSTWHDVFYTNSTREGTTLPNFVSDWFEGLENEIPGYKVNEKSLLNEKSGKPTSKSWFLFGHNAVGITFEIGDNTDRDFIPVVSGTAAKEMMKLLLKK